MNLDVGPFYSIEAGSFYVVKAIRKEVLSLYMFHDVFEVRETTRWRPPDPTVRNRHFGLRPRIP